jgi:hypothetical protein
VFAGEEIIMQELMYLERLFGRGNSVWIAVTLLSGFLLVLIFRPNAIHRPVLFRVACWLLALTAVVPSALSLLLGMYSSGGGYPGRMSPGSEMAFIMGCANFSGPVLEGACIICGLTALLPPMTRREPPTGPAKHPLE